MEIVHICVGFRERGALGTFRGYDLTSTSGNAAASLILLPHEQYLLSARHSAPCSGALPELRTVYI